MRYSTRNHPFLRDTPDTAELRRSPQLAALTAAQTMTAEDVRAELDAHGLTDLVAEICRRRGVTLGELCGPTRTRSISYARHETWAAIHGLPFRHYSYAEIGRLFGRDHSTVLLGIRAHSRRAPVSP